MHRRLVRVSLVLIMLATVIGAVLSLLQTQRQIDDDQRVEQLFVASTSALTVGLAELRAAQHAYVAAGQDPGQWVEQVSARMADITSGLRTLTQLARTTPAIEALEEAGALMERFERVDTLVRENTEADHNLMASDLIFTDGFELATLVRRQLELARTAEQEGHGWSREQQRQKQAVALAAWIVTIVAVTLLLLPVRAARRAAGPPGTGEKAVEATVSEANAPPIEASKPGDPTPAITSASPHHAELHRAAELCTDLGRLASTDQLPPLLERTADLLHATGLIVWVRDTSGTGLRPAVAHGYSDETLARLGSIACSSDNAAAEAFRTRQLQIVPVDGAGRGALVAPMLGPHDCIGVISAEVKAGWESSADVQATASILAAQFATVVDADPLNAIDHSIDLEAGRAQQ